MDHKLGLTFKKIYATLDVRSCTCYIPFYISICQSVCVQQIEIKMKAIWIQFNNANLEKSSIQNNF